MRKSKEGIRASAQKYCHILSTAAQRQTARSHLHGDILPLADVDHVLQTRHRRRVLPDNKGNLRKKKGHGTIRKHSKCKEAGMVHPDIIANKQLMYWHGRPLLGASQFRGRESSPGRSYPMCASFGAGTLRTPPGRKRPPCTSFGRGTRQRCCSRRHRSPVPAGSTG